MILINVSYVFPEGVSQIFQLSTFRIRTLQSFASEKFPAGLKVSILVLNNMTLQPLILFDWDLTLVGSERQKICVFFRALWKNFPRSLLVLHKLKNLFHMNVVDFIHIMGDRRPLNIILKEYHEECNRFSHLVSFRGLPVLRFLKKNGFRVGIITNDYSPNITFLCKKYNIKIEYIADTTRVREKPNPVSINLALKHFRVKPKNAFYIGDAPTDVRAGKRAGVKTIAIKTLYHSRRVLKREHPDFIVDDIHDVIGIVTRKGF